MTTPGTVTELITECLRQEDLPLAIYREVAAHLQQVPQVQVELELRRSPKFNYFHSQIGEMHLRYPADLPQGDRQQIEAILSFYAGRYGAWQRDSVTPE
ncbi:MULTISPECIES: hypothetical protein [Cyanophyceae]|uniref:hypothetical protein n=1 Tax=Cyanophyceae TaxID=3028117 RepID=UPI0002FF2221|nr:MULTISPECIES: hypothetical protein [Cyanophyceae]SMH29554.1 hypothetical protein SAMN06272755_0111 [Picosynechococcus sp. OG1]SMQ83732.1 hypothetical protein SAMN06272774_2488 [Synechococcus sp. 7002]